MVSMISVVSMVYRQLSDSQWQSIPQEGNRDAKRLPPSYCCVSCKKYNSLHRDGDEALQKVTARRSAVCHAEKVTRHQSMAWTC